MFFHRLISMEIRGKSEIQRMIAQCGTYKFGVLYNPVSIIPINCALEVTDESLSVSI
jgi:hypothetical protein